MKRILFILAVLSFVCTSGAGATEPFTEQENFGHNAWMTGSWGDYDNDGDLDLAVGCQGPYDQLYVNNGDGTFTGEDQFGEGYYRYSCIWGDYDNDGDLDMLQGNATGGRLYTNNGDGSFDEGLPLVQHGTSRTPSVAWADYDNDGDLDCVLANYEILDVTPNVLCINNGDGTFTEQVLGWARTFSMAWGDYDGDGDPDLAVGNYTLYEGEEPTSVYINNGNGTFTAYTILSDEIPCQTMAVAWGDYDNDGDLDLAVGNSGSNSLWVNIGDGILVEHTEFGVAEVTQSVQWADYDNDGDLDLAAGNAYEENDSYLYINNGDGSFTQQLEFGVGKDTYSVAWGDYDRDGDQDLACINILEQNYLYINNEDDVDYLSIHLVGHFHDQGAGFSNRDGVGAKVSVYSEGHVGEADYFLGFREIEENCGRGQNSVEAEFGLPNDRHVDVLVVWPGSDGDHIEEYWPSVAKAQFITLDEGTGLPTSTGVVAIDPLGLGLSSVFPNPASGDPTISFALPRSCAISLQVFDVQGRLIKTVAKGEHRHGNHSVVVKDLSNGVYMYRLEADGFSETRKMVILR